MEGFKLEFYKVKDGDSLAPVVRNYIEYWERFEKIETKKDPKIYPNIEDHAIIKRKWIRVNDRLIDYDKQVVILIIE